MSPIPLCFSPIFFILRIAKYFLIAGMPSREQLFSVICGTFVCYVVIYHFFRLRQYSTTTCSQVQFPIKELVAMLKFCLQDIWWQCLAVILSVWRTSHY